jgi:DNA-binding response OmpR family regulator
VAELLLVEDDPDIGDQLAAALAGQGHQVRWARTGGAALDHVGRGERVDLVLLDLGLPDIDGTALCRRLRARLADTIIVMLTARTDEIDVVLGLDAGADDYLTKPFRLLELLSRVRAHLRRRPHPAHHPRPPPTASAGSRRSRPPGTPRRCSGPAPAATSAPARSSPAATPTWSSPPRTA